MNIIWYAFEKVSIKEQQKENIGTRTDWFQWELLQRMLYYTFWWNDRNLILNCKYIDTKYNDAEKTRVFSLVRWIDWTVSVTSLIGTHFIHRFYYRKQNICVNVEVSVYGLTSLLLFLSYFWGVYIIQFVVCVSASRKLYWAVLSLCKQHIDLRNKISTSIHCFNVFRSL